MTMYVLRIEIDGHFHGSREVPKPWVARIDGMCSRYGLQRTFIDKMPDYRDYRRAWSGNEYGVVAAFPLRADTLYEVSRLRGRSSKRHVAREFVWCDGQRLHRRTHEEVLAFVDQDDGPALHVRLPDNSKERPWVAEVTGLGMPRLLGWVTVAQERWYRLREGHLYEIRDMVSTRRNGPEVERRRLVTARSGELVHLSHEQAIEHVRGAA